MWTVDLDIQPLTSPDSPEGARHRLDNLGFFAQETETSDGSESSSLALMRFQSVCDEQQKNEQQSNGKMDDTTRDKLKEAYGT
jgi:hypothetical protein